MKRELQKSQQSEAAALQRVKLYISRNISIKKPT